MHPWLPPSWCSQNPSIVRSCWKPLAHVQRCAFAQASPSLGVPPSPVHPLGSARPTAQPSCPSPAPAFTHTKHGTCLSSPLLPPAISFIIGFNVQSLVLPGPAHKRLRNKFLNLLCSHQYLVHFKYPVNTCSLTMGSPAVYDVYQR